MSVVVKGFNLFWEGNGKTQAAEVDVDITASLDTGVWLADGDLNKSTAGFRMIVGQRNPEDAARTYAAYRKALGWNTASVYRLFPLIRTEPIAENQLGDTGEETWSAFADAWIEVRL